MQKISYRRAAISSLPVVGPFISLYNLKEVDTELSILLRAAFESITQNFKTATKELEKKTSVLNMFKQGKSLVDIAVVDLLTNQSSEDNFNADTSHQKKIISLRESLLIYRKGQIYSTCGIVGNILTIAMMVSLIASRNIVVSSFSALKITANIINIFCAALLVIQSCELCNMHINHTRDNERLQALTT